eukprot:m51a1_g11660 hypothetical protein (662) ;mRNA; r:4420-7516
MSLGWESATKARLAEEIQACGVALAIAEAEGAAAEAVAKGLTSAKECLERALAASRLLTQELEEEKRHVAQEDEVDEEEDEYADIQVNPKTVEIVGSILAARKRDTAAKAKAASQQAHLAKAEEAAAARAEEQTRPAEAMQRALDEHEQRGTSLEPDATANAEAQSVELAQSEQRAAALERDAAAKAEAAAACASPAFDWFKAAPCFCERRLRAYKKAAEAIPSTNGFVLKDRNDLWTELPVYLLHRIGGSLLWVSFARQNLLKPEGVLEQLGSRHIEQLAESHGALGITDTSVKLVVYLLALRDPYASDPAFALQMYVGKAALGIENRWCDDGKSHMAVVFGLLRKAYEDAKSLLSLRTRAEATAVQVRLGKKPSSSSMRTPQLCEALLALRYNGSTFADCALFAVGKATDEDSLTALEDDVIEALHTKDMRYVKATGVSDDLRETPYLRLLRTGAGAEDAEAVCVCGALSSEETDEAEEQEAVCAVCAAASQSAYYRVHRGDPLYRLLLAYWREALARDEENETDPSAESKSKRGRPAVAALGKSKKPLWDDEFQLRPTPFFDVFEHQYFPGQSLDVALGQPADGKKGVLWTKFEPDCRGELGHMNKSLLPWQMTDVAMRVDGDGELLDHMLIKEKGESAEDFARRAFQGEEEEDDSNE